MQITFLLACLVGVTVATTTLTDGGTCSENGRATKYDSCPKCGWKIHAPTTPGEYTLMRKYETVHEMRDGFVCYMGRTGNPAQSSQHTQPNFSERFGRGYFWETGEPPLSTLGTTGIPWLQDPTQGMQKYDNGCKYINDLLVPREDGQAGFSLKAMRPPTASAAYVTEDSNGWPDLDDAYTLRLESKDVVNGGLFVIDVDRLPYGAGVWPAFWMLGSDPNDWLAHPPKTPGMAQRNYWPNRGEIDIIEYINAYTTSIDTSNDWRNHVTLHTDAGCESNRSSPYESGHEDTSSSQRCNAGFDGSNDATKGCSMSMSKNTVGHQFFQGAQYVCEWVQDSHVDCWFFNKNETGTYKPGSDYRASDGSPPVRTSPVDFRTATSVNVSELGLPDVRHDLAPGCRGPTADRYFSDMRFVINTVLCGQWPNAVTTNVQPIDTGGVSYNGASCENVMRGYIGTPPKQHGDGSRDYLDRRFDWDISFIKIFT